MSYYLTILLFVVSGLSFAQFSDDFSDGDFTSSPTWSGMTSNFEINSLNELHLLAPAVDDTSYLSVASTNITTTWDFYVRMEFNPSSSNLTRVYLVSDNADLSASLNGYFVLIGNTSDEISLYRQTGTTITEIIDGVDFIVNADPVNARIRVTRDALGNWELLRDATGGYSFTSEGTVNDNTYTSTSFFGVWCKYTSSRSELFYFDNVGDPYVDATPPTILTATPISVNQLDVQFSEPLDEVIAETISNYSVNNSIGVPSAAVLDMTDPSLVHLTFGNNFVNATNYTLTVNNIEDIATNIIVSPSTINFFYFIPELAVSNDVIITEVFADPSPVVGLPEVEFIEIYNRSAKYFDLAGWKIGDASSEVVLSSYILAPGQYLVLCATGNESLFGISNIIPCALPSFNNDGDAVRIKTDTDLLLDSIFFNLSWYQNTIKDDGGWTLERKHLNAPCSDLNNWSASENGLGGTPGVQNSIWTDVDDTTTPFISNFIVMDEMQTQVFLNESLDTSNAIVVSISPTVSSMNWNYVSSSQVTISHNSFVVNVLYTITMSNVSDCWGNTTDLTFKVGMPDSVEPEDIVINEIMFNPLTNGSDYVELYNRSQKIIDLSDLYLANWDDDSVANYEIISTSQYLLLPGEYALLTEDSTDIQHDFDIYGVGRFVIMDVPTYSDDSGTVFLINANANFIDYFHYDDNMHYVLISDDNGKSLERISFITGMNNPENWHTASELVQWGTPGYLNSQNLYPEVTGTVSVTPELFSPDNDGYNDLLLITMDFTTTDNVVNIEIYDNQGRLVKELKDSYFVGTTGTVQWDGSTDEGTKAPIGTYIVLVSVLDAEGNQSQYKKVCVIGGQL